MHRPRLHPLSYLVSQFHAVSASLSSGGPTHSVTPSPTDGDQITIPLVTPTGARGRSTVRPAR